MHFSLLTEQTPPKKQEEWKRMSASKTRNYLKSVNNPNEKKVKRKHYLMCVLTVQV